MTTERRFTNSRPIHRATTAGGGSNGRTVWGYAALFNNRSENLGTPSSPLFEVIAPGAFDGVLVDDVRALFNHDANLILARSKGGKGTLKIGTDSTGLWYQFEAPSTSAGNDLLVSLKRGDIDQSSFGFTVAAGGDRYTKEKGGTLLRTIHRIGSLLDVSPVAFPAYANTTSGARNLAGRESFANPAPIRGAVAARLGLTFRK